MTRRPPVGSGPDSKEAVRGFAARSVTENGRGVAVTWTKGSLALVVTQGQRPTLERSATALIQANKALNFTTA